VQYLRVTAVLEHVMHPFASLVLEPDPRAMQLSVHGEIIPGKDVDVVDIGRWLHRWYDGLIVLHKEGEEGQYKKINDNM
jgi:hypothetical protein